MPVVFSVVPCRLFALALLWLGKGLAPGWLHDCSSHLLGLYSETFSDHLIYVTFFPQHFLSPGLPHFFPLALSQHNTLYVILAYFALH